MKEIIVVECTVPSCSKVFKGLLSQAEARLWENIKPVTGEEPPLNSARPKQTGRTHLGWCHECAAKFGVK